MYLFLFLLIVTVALYTGNLSDKFVKHQKLFAQMGSTNCTMFERAFCLKNECPPKTVSCHGKYAYDVYAFPCNHN